MPSILVVSDTHWPAPGSADNWAAVTGWLEGNPVDLVVHAGDASLDGAHEPDQIDAAGAVMAALPGPWRAVPGNHDIGDSSVPGSKEPPVTDALRRRWLDAVGDDHWAVELGSWLVVGLDSQLFGSGLAAEAEQWDWLLALAPAPGTHVAAVTHKPLHATPGEREAAPPHRYLGAEVCSGLRAAPAARALELVVSGHVHQHRDLTAGGVRHLWAPSAWAALPERVQATVGTKRCGAVLVHLGDDGTVDARLLQPEGLAQHVIGDTVPDPYAARR